MLFCTVESILELLQHGFEKRHIYWNMWFTFESADSCLQSVQHYIL